MKRRELAFDPNFEKEHELLSKEYSDTFDKKLLTITKKEPDSKDPLLALRCRVSFPIYEKINFLFFYILHLMTNYYLLHNKHHFVLYYNLLINYEKKSFQIIRHDFLPMPE